MARTVQEIVEFVEKLEAMMEKGVETSLSKLYLDGNMSYSAIQLGEVLACQALLKFIKEGESDAKND